MQVPLLDIKAQNAPLRDELAAAVERVLDSGIFILGPEVEQLERDLAQLSQCKHALGMSSGTDALLVALMALDIGPGDEVLVPDFTFFATASCVTRLGATPVFVDVRESDYNMDPEDAERKLSSRTKAIIPVHLYGQMAPMWELKDIARRRGIPVIEDAAQSLGAEQNGTRACSIGDIGITSFYPTKNLGAMGDAGMLLCSYDGLAEKCRQLRNHGMEPRYYHSMIGGNFRLDAIQAAFLRVKLPHLESYAEGRRRHATFLQNRLQALGNASIGPSEDADLILPLELEGNRSVWNQYTIRVRGSGRRDALKQFLGARGISSEIYYPLPLHEQACFGGRCKGGDSCPVATQITKEVLSLPIYPEMSPDQLEAVASSVESFFGSGSTGS